MLWCLRYRNTFVKCITCAYRSISDIVFDFIIFLEYMEGSKEFNKYWVEDQISAGSLETPQP